ncbi:ShlB/FhaC/HecB family hemolysin secretion/activation protein [Xenophilus arseniciresistens]|uniref:ShlB/FhaC/HecB family hemolysin secretion/activation protein n=1 Tax=Xenophilus arseniciresistens TaxID=1283306 RepID=A0AAE3N7S5_9BURK|nr:ShlB/FhaC/HecB family hemolysin secretion/activation protein [Xenophilus arseniciresistens]MDA7416438.1 ShlB/FhaC/HecB family hemolysin secretion/activation protein [Xenophilus arseniciresistens]
MAQSNPTAPNPFIEEIRQQERERALREQQERSVDARLQRQGPASTQRLPDAETPCFRIDRITLGGELAGEFQWALQAAGGESGNDSPLGRCLGTEGINIVLSRLQQAVIAQGYVTTRVLAGPQDLTRGELALTLVPGRITAIRFASDPDAGPTPSKRLLLSAVPAGVGDLLNIRDIEQGLENLKRAPTAEADIQIEPSKSPDARPGDSELVVRYAQGRRLRGALSLDDSGTEATGRYQMGLTASADSLLGLNDLFYLSANHSIDDHFLGNPRKGTEGQTLHYSVPYGYWLAGFTASRSRYRQSVAGLSQDYVYGGRTENAEIKLSRLVWRSQQHKTTLSLRGFRRESRSEVDDTEIEVQHRVVGGWELGLNHKAFIGQATLEGNLTHRRGTGAFGALPAPEEAYGEGTSRMRLWAADVQLTLPFQWGEQKLRYAGQWRAQWNRTPLTPQDRFAIGGRYSVRGFDGETSLLAERGWLLRNDLGWAMGASGAELYVGLDYGHVGGPSTRYLLGNHLAGAVLGVRGALRTGPGTSSLNYDLFIGAPVWKPEGFPTARMTAGFNLNYSF